MNITDKPSKTIPGKAELVIPGRIWWAGAIGVAAAVVCNLIVRAVLFALLPLPEQFLPLQPTAIATFTVSGTALAAVVFALVVRFSVTPIRTFRVIAIVALVVSILPNLGLMANPSAAPFPGGSALAFGVLCIFHGIAALVCAAVLTTLTQKH